MQVVAMLSPQFDVCFALAQALSGKPPDGLRPDRSAWLEDARRFGWQFWVALPDVLGAERPADSFLAFIEALQAVPAEVARARMARGLFHEGDEQPAERSRKREWLAFLGLDEDVPAGRTAVLKHEAETLVRAAVPVLEKFWHDFAPVWAERVPAQEELRQRAAALTSRDFADIAGELVLNVEVADGRIKALRGGFEIAIEDIETAYLIPSFVNSEGFWSVADESLPATAFFPFIDSDRRVVRSLDPWLVCRALGDPTRAAMVRRLSARPMTSAELMRVLGLSRANVSHHVFQLRAAGLITEEPAGRAVRMALNWQRLDGLSGAFRQVLARQEDGDPERRQ